MFINQSCLSEHWKAHKATVLTIFAAVNEVTGRNHEIVFS